MIPRAYCWACDSRMPVAPCPYCAAPEWNGTVTRSAIDGPGVYVLSSECGMAKIGVSTRDAGRRASTVCRRAFANDVWVWPVAFLDGAGFPVEQWLHKTFAHTRDERWARSELLPHPSEWFWPTPALADLIYGWHFVDRLEPEMGPGKWASLPDERSAA